MPFYTLEISDDRYSEPGLMTVTAKSRALRRRGDVTFFVPPDSTAKVLPVVTLLHGVYGSHWAWSLKGGAHRVLMRLLSAGEVPPMMLAMPSDGLWGDGSGYLQHQDADYEQWIASDVQEIAEKLHAGTLMAPRFISGLSMGGYGALRLGGLHPLQFAGISAHSSITDYSQMADFLEEPLDAFKLAGNAPTSVLEALLMNRDRLPPLRFDCGSEDPLIQPNRELHWALEKASVPHVFEEFTGGHTWAYWHEHLADSLRFFASLL